MRYISDEARKRIKAGRDLAWVLVLTFLALMLIAAISAAKAADLSMCGPFASVNKRLEDAGETAMFRLIYHNPGEEPQTRIIYGNPQTHTYTVVVDKGGYACTMYDGEGFYAIQ